jgi:hypothetical protein
MAAPFAALPVVSLLVALAGTASAAEPDAPWSPPTHDVELPQCFVAQGGAYVMRGQGLSASLESGRLRWLISDGDGESRVVTVEPVGARAAAIPVGERLLPGTVSRFHGGPDQWQTGAATFGAVRYAELWQGIDLLLEAEGDLLKGTYVVAPGADPGDVRMRHHGGDSVRIDSCGRLVVTTAVGELVDDAPVAWQQVGEERVGVSVAFALEPAAGDAVDVVFALGAHDRTLPLLIDPAVIVQAGFLGGSERDQVAALAVGDDGSLYLTGFTSSTEATFPVTVGPDLTWAGPPLGSQGDVFVAKLDPTGDTLIYAGYIGGTNYDYASGIAVDSLGRAYISGRTGSTQNQGFPVTVGPDLTHNGDQDAFVARVSADGTSLEYCGYLGGNSEDRGLGIAVDELFRAYVVGRFESLTGTLPLLVGPSIGVPSDANNAFVARVAPGGASLEYCGYIGGSDVEDATGVAVDQFGAAWVTGWTLSTDLPVVGGPDLTHNGGVDVFLAHVANDGSSLISCGYLGGSASDFPIRPVLDDGNSLYISGYATDAASFPALVGPLLVPTDTGSGFLTKVQANGLGLVWSGFTPGPFSGAIDVDADDGLWFTSALPDGPIGGLDLFVGRVLPSGTGFDQLELLGSPGDDSATDMALVPAALTPGVQELWITSFTALDESVIPVVSGPDLTQNGDVDTLVMRIQFAPDPWTDLGLPKAGTYGDPLLTGAGTMGPLSPLVLTLSSALENTTAWLAVGFATVYVPFKGGTFIPDISLPGFLVPVPTDANGGVVLSDTTPAGSPPGFSFYAQYWIQDPGAAGAPVSASNGLQGTTP